jgi:hypothetical protein
MKKVKKTIERNTGPHQKGGGDFYGTGVKQPVAKSLDVFPRSKTNGKNSLSKKTNLA